ncbi:DUF6153 family protein [Rhizohabitans arisaemae]|uniref:DUF6153 family protein n=1 Tax=Rhizohabitans arisaemae TaxID=2720610 RepID=UPI0024B1E271|nr:DUF6153 family protein [Rhizohabitans arisaemae]
MTASDEGEGMGGSARRRLAGVWCRMLLGTLLLGVVTMHTLGHPDMGHGAHGKVAVAGHAQASAGSLESEVRSAPGGALPDLDPTTVCLAVLTALLALIIAMAARWLRSDPWAAGAERTSASAVARPPPRRRRANPARLVVLRI